MSDGLDGLKQAAAREALDLVQDDMVLGLGSGSTAELFVEALAGRVATGLRVRGVATSRRVAELAQRHQIPLIDGERLPRLDLTVDGADEIEPRTLGLVKGRGGALLREKLVAAVSDRVCIIADDSKLVGVLGEHLPVPVAVVPFGWQQTAERVARLGGVPTLRQDGSQPFVSDDGLYILDCRFGPIVQPARLSEALKETLGVVEHGIFLGLAWRAIVAGASGVTVFEPGRVPA